MNRRNLIAAATAALGGLASAAGARHGVGPRALGDGRVLSAASFGAAGDGRADDTAALQAALDAAFAPGRPTVLVIPPGDYRVTRTLRVALEGKEANIGHQSGIVGHGARINSTIEGGRNVLELVSRATVRFILIEGLDILGTGREGHGIYLECDRNQNYLYNFCLRDVVVQSCGGDGCRMLGNVFESQVIDCSFRDNKANGATFAHGFHGGILSSIHVFGCVFADNARYGAHLTNKCYDVSFHGCRFVRNGAFGLSAETGCTLLSDCAFEDNHARAAGFGGGGAAIDLRDFGTLLGCTGYSRLHQTHLIHAYVMQELVLLGCHGSGAGPADRAGLARLAGLRGAHASLVGCSGSVEYEGGFEAVALGGDDGGVRCGSDWHSRDLPRLGAYRLWVDGRGRLRLKNGAPASDEDGIAVGA